MLFKRFYDDRLAQASYLLGCEQTREAVVVDPNVEIVQYVRAAAAESMRISHVTETHIHADFVSGARALVSATGATLHLSGESGHEWAYTDEALSRARRLREGSEISAGSVRLRAMHTPGHTPEHLTFLVADLERGDEAVGALTGDFIFVGDVGRPDLLERAAGVRGSMEASAADLFNSIQRFLTYPDRLQIWPGHGAGSACGKSLGSMPQSTLGYERLFNWALTTTDKEEFVERVLEDQPVPPIYFARMKALNRAANASIGRAAPHHELELADLERAFRAGATIVDTRSAEQFAQAHIPGTLNIPNNRSFLNWCGALVPEDRDLYLIVDEGNGETFGHLFLELSKIGFDGARGYFTPKILAAWLGRHGPLERVPQLDPVCLAQLGASSDVTVVDVRGSDEWKHGHLPGAVHIPLASLPNRIGELTQCSQIVLQCQSGGRSSVAASFIKARGIANVSNLVGGLDGWAKQGFEVVAEPAKPGDTTARKT